MTAVESRRFLSTLGSAGALLASGSWLEAIGYAQAGERRARALIQQARAAPFDRRLLGSFLEHLGRAIYTGVYQPGSPLADANGCTDVTREVRSPACQSPAPGRELRLRLWPDGVGP
jgi:alpha-N-arabinofuranosidase